jgi:phosphoribosyl 1,2-cyclic phosphodiesterase
MKITVLASGSGGNTTYLESNGTKILIDCGITNRQITKRLEERELTIDGLKAIIITHEHSDHIKGVDVTLRKTDAVCYLTKETYEGMYFKTKDNLNTDKLSFIEPYTSFKIEDIEIVPISISHDSSDAVGFIIHAEDKKIVYITDVGYLPVTDHERLQNADIYIFESNYDVTKLFTSNRPFYLKQRIDSVKGHLSNNDSAYNMTQLIGENTKKIILAHRSKECNTDDLALDTYRDVFQEYGFNSEDYNIEVAKQDIPTKLLIF